MNSDGLIVNGDYALIRRSAVSILFFEVTRRFETKDSGMCRLNTQRGDKMSQRKIR